MHVYVLQSSRISWKHWLWDTARKRNAFLLFSIVLRIFQSFNFGTTGPIQVGFSAKCTSPNEDINQIENWKCHIFNFRLIPLDRITYSLWNRGKTCVLWLLAWSMPTRHDKIGQILHNYSAIKQLVMLWGKVTMKLPPHSYFRLKRPCRSPIIDQHIQP